jgi:hypothetical protein
VGGEPADAAITPPCIHNTLQKKKIFPLFRRLTAAKELQPPRKRAGEPTGNGTEGAKGEEKKRGERRRRVFLLSSFLLLFSARPALATCYLLLSSLCPAKTPSERSLNQDSLRRPQAFEP